MTNATHPFDALMDITARPPTVFVSGEGSYLWDDSGKRYLDFMQGWAVNCLGHSPAGRRRCACRAGQAAADAEPGVLQRAEPEARASAGREQLLRPGVLHQLRRRSQRGRDQARAQIRRAAQERRVRDHHLRRRLPRPHARDHVGSGKKAFEPLFEPKVTGFPKAKLNDLASVEAADHRQDRRRDAGADPGRSRRVARDRSIPAGSCAR